MFLGKSKFSTHLQNRDNKLISTQTVILFMSPNPVKTKNTTHVTPRMSSPLEATSVAMRILATPVLKSSRACSRSTCSLLHKDNCTNKPFDTNLTTEKYSAAKNKQLGNKKTLFYYLYAQRSSHKSYKLGSFTLRFS